jgi:hypothetical protein
MFMSDCVLGSAEVQKIASIGASARVTRSRDMQNTGQRGSRSAEVLDADTQRADGTAEDPRVDDTDPGARMRTSVRRQREEFGGLNWGSAFFGWLVAVGIATLLTALLSAAGAAVGLTKATTDAADSAGTVGIVGGVLLLVILLLAYYAGGYVAGRMSRFDGARQGIGVWAIGLLITLAAAVLAVIAGSEYNVVERANLPRLPVGTETLTTGGAIASIVILAGTLLFAALGGIAGARYHRKVDRAGFPA